MAPKSKSSASRRGLSRINRDYWEQTRKPWPSLVFLLPMLALYELGVLWVGGQHADLLRSGADVWLRGLLSGIGLWEPWWPPVMTIVGLLSWQWIARHPWKISLETLSGMFAESVVFAFVLVLLGQIEGLIFTKAFSELTQAEAWSLPVVSLTPGEMETLARALGFVGAGIYEEVLFRLALLPLLIEIAWYSALPKAWAPTVGALVTSILFAAAHHWGPRGEPFQLYRFTFRTLAGGVFAALFVLRGFGITVGSHAIYDLIVGVLMSE